MNDDLQLPERLHDGTLSDGERVALAERLRQDAPLRRHLAEERIMIRRLGALLSEEDATAVADRVLHLLVADRPSRVLRLASAVRRRTQHGSGRTSRRPLPVHSWPLAAAALLMIGLGWWAWRANPLTVPGSVPATPAETNIAVLVGTNDGVQVIRDGRALETRAGMALRSEDRIDNAAAQSAEILYPDQTRLQVQAATDVRLWDEHGAKRVRLERGEVRAEVASQPPGKAMRLLTAQAEVEVIGTRFTLSTNRGLTHLAVAQGTVSLRRLDGTVSVVKSSGTAEAGTADPAAVAAPSRPQPLPLVMAFDFENGVLPPEWVMGRIVAGPPRAGNAFCLSAQANAEAPWAKVQWDADKARAPLLYAEGLVLSFDYWVDEPTRSLDIYLRNDSQQAIFGDRHLFNLIPRTWTRVAVRLDELRATDANARQRAGDRIALLVIQVGQQGGVLQVDNLEIAPARITSQQSPGP